MTPKLIPTFNLLFLIHQSDFKDHVYFVNQLLTLSASTKNNLVPINVIKNEVAKYFDDPGWYVTLTPKEVTPFYDKSERKFKHVITQHFFITRKISGLFLHVYLPSFILSIASSMSLFIPYYHMPARMSLSATTSLSTITLFVKAKDSWPKTSYIKLIGVWVTICYIIVFFCLLEYCLVLALMKLPPGSNQVQDTNTKGDPTKKKRQCWALTIEKLAKLFVPSFLVSATIIYYLVCILH